MLKCGMNSLIAAFIIAIVYWLILYLVKFAPFYVILGTFRMNPTTIGINT